MCFFLSRRGVNVMIQDQALSFQINSGFLHRKISTYMFNTMFSNALTQKFSRKCLFHEVCYSLLRLWVVIIDSKI